MSGYGAYNVVSDRRALVAEVATMMTGGLRTGTMCDVEVFDERFG